MKVKSRYNFKLIEEKWQKYWEVNKSFSVGINKSKKKFYCLEMFPYPSEKYTWDMFEIIQWNVLARYKSLKGFNVLHPMGWDSFGMPAENTAKQNNLDQKMDRRKYFKNEISIKKTWLSIDWDKKYQLVQKIIININKIF